MIRLKSYTKVPPGSYRYEQDGVKFGPNCDIEYLADEIMDYRKGNNLPRSKYGECLEDADAFTCAALGNDPRFCFNTERPFRSLRPEAGKGCRTCGAKV